MRKIGFLLHVLLIVMAAGNLQACGSLQQMIQGTPTFTSTPTLTPTLTATITPTRTPTPTITPSPTLTPDVIATKQYSSFFSLVQKYYEAGQIPSTDGKYVKIDDYEDHATGWHSYQFRETSVKAKNFIVKADFNWSNNVKTTTFSGCAFIFRYQEDQSHYLIVVDSIQGIRLLKNIKGSAISMGPPSRGEKSDYNFGASPYHATFTLIVYELFAYVYVDDFYYGDYRLLKDNMTDSGSLNAGVLAASNNGWTTCKMKNIQAWIIDP